MDVVDGTSERAYDVGAGSSGRSLLDWMVMVELTGMDGTAHTHESAHGGATAIEHSSATIGLTLADGKRTPTGLQGHLIRGADEGILGRSTAPFCILAGQRRNRRKPVEMFENDVHQRFVDAPWRRGVPLLGAAFSILWAATHSCGLSGAEKAMNRAENMLELILLLEKHSWTKPDSPLTLRLEAALAEHIATIFRSLNVNPREPSNMARTHARAW
jgi:hypothetical protein